MATEMKRKRQEAVKPGTNRLISLRRQSLQYKAARFLAAVFVCAFCWLQTIAAEAATLNAVRVGAVSAKTRIVLDMDEVPQYTVKKAGKVLTVDIDSKLAKTTVPAIKDTLVEQVTLTKISRYKTRVTIILRKPVDKYHVFTLKNPQRLIVDFPKGVEAPVKSKETKKLDDGLVYTSWRDDLGGLPVWLHIVEMAPKSNYELRPLLGQGENIEKARLLAMTKRDGAKAAINASYFDSTVWVIGNLKIKNQWLGAELTPRTAFFVDKSGEPQIATGLAYKGNVTRTDGKTAAITGINRERQPNDLILYNSYFGARTGTNQWGVEVYLKNDTVFEVKKGGNGILRHGITILSGHGTGADFLSSLKAGQKVTITNTVGRKPANEAQFLLGAGPLLVQEGLPKVRSVEEQFARDIAVGRAPRTAIGIKKDGTILLVAVEGRSANSAGLTLEELAAYLVKLGAKDAMNFDGGGSTEMVINNEIMNDPSDGNERPIRVGLGIFRR